METLVLEEKLEAISEIVIKNSEDITALNFKVDDIRARLYSVEGTMETMATKDDLVALEYKLEKMIDGKINRLEQKLDFVVKKLS